MDRRTVLIGGMAVVSAWNSDLSALSLGNRALADAVATADIRPTIDSLTCEYALNPLGIEAARPRLSWMLRSARRGERQIAYRVEAASSVQGLHNGHANLWDSGKVPSSQSIQVRYDGTALASRQRCYWRVTVWNQDGRPSTSEERAFWEMGLLSPDDWTARWIGFPGGWPGRALYFRGEFGLDKPVQKARAYVSGLGYYEFSVNGHSLDERKLDPGWTDYTKRIQYATFDIIDFLRPGENVFAAVVGRGWYGDPIFLLQAEIEYTDGSRQLLRTLHDINHPDLHWQITSGPVVANSIYDGEIYDARLEKTGWNLPGKAAFDVSDRREGWVTANAVSSPGGRLVSEQQEPIKVVDTLKPQAATMLAPGIQVFDAGHNMAGWARIRLRGATGQRIVLKFAETLLDNGTVNQANLRKADATDEYICKDGDEVVWEPQFTYHGFRYMQVEGYPGKLGTEDILFRQVRSSVGQSGSFQCSEPLINQIQEMVYRTESSNLYGVPTDCPQRDERMGWMNDLTVRLEESLYNFQLPRFYRKFLDDVADTQGTDGAIADTAPFRWGTNPADPVSASYLLMGWLLYRHYGDLDVLGRHYRGFKAWVDFLLKHSSGYIVNYGYYGDWSPPAAFGAPFGSPASKDTPIHLMSTGYLFYTAQILSQIATVLNQHADAQNYRALGTAVAQAFNREFWDPSKGGYGANNQAANAFALYLGIVPSDRIGRVVSNLIDDVKAHDYHLTTGNLCTKYLLEALSYHGHADIAYRIATQESYPSWGFMLANGATTLWERWENMTGAEMNSHTHPMMGSVSSCFFKYLAGINVAEGAPGFQEILIRPYFLEDLSWAAASYDSLFGTIRSSWRRLGSSLELELTIPPNTHATIHLPSTSDARISESGKELGFAEGVESVRNDGKIVMVRIQAGTYHFRIA